MILWIIGLAGSGKTTIGKSLYQELKKKEPSTVFIDGDEFRKIFKDDIGHDLHSRKINSERLKQICLLLDSQIINVICSVLSIFQEDRDWCRENMSKFYEIYIKVPMEILKARDQKNLYSKALNGQIKNVVGVDLEFSEPTKPDIIIKNSEGLDRYLSNVNKILKILGYS